MKKKVLSVVLASALFAGSAIAVSAVTGPGWDTSSKAKTDDDITALEFDAESYTIKSGSSENLAGKLTAYAGTTAIVQEPELEWEISENDLVFSLDTTEEGKAVVYAYENSGSATVTVTANDGKVKAFCKVVAAPLVKATGFKFDESSYKLKAGATDEAGGKYYTVDSSVKLVPTPSGAKFSEGQLAFLRDSVKVALVATKATNDYVANQIVVGPLAGTVDDGAVKYTFSIERMTSVNPNLTAAKLYAYTVDAESPQEEIPLITNSSIKTSVQFPNYDTEKGTKGIARDARASTERGIIAERAGRTGAITIEVGQSVELKKFVNYGPSTATVGKEVTDWHLDYYNEAATDDDFAVLNEDGNKVMGIAVGRVKAVGTFTNKLDPSKTSTVEIPINVVAKGTNAKPETPAETTENATLAIGGTYWVESGNANTTWTVDNDNVTILPEVGAGCKVFAKKAGTATVTGTVDGKVVKTVTITIEAAGAATPDVPAETNPSTGDSLLAFLF